MDMNENTRLMLALALTIVVLVVWNLIFPPPKYSPLTKNGTNPQKKTTTSSNTFQKNISPPKQIPTSSFLTSSGEKITITTPLYRAILNSQGGIIESFELKKYKKTISPHSPDIQLVNRDALPKGPLGIIWNYNPTWKLIKWEYSGANKNLSGDNSYTVVFKGTFQGLTFVKSLTFWGNSYKIDQKIELVNRQNQPLNGILGISLASPKMEAGNRFNKISLIYYTLKKSLKKNYKEKKLKPGIEYKEPVLWAGIENNYFLVAAIPLNGRFIFKGKLEDGIYRIALESPVHLSAGETKTFKEVFYLGPKLHKYLAPLPHHLSAAINYGWLDFLSKPLVIALDFFYKYTGNYGIAIILLTVVIKILFWPLSHKSYKSMEQMKKLQPILQQLKEKYKDDKERLNQEMMQIYKTYKINPAGGCVPMLLQIPVFIALYEALLSAIELRHAPFITYLPFTHHVWLADLSAKDPYYITPLLMGITMFIQQKMSPTTGDPTQAKLMLLMPVVLTFLFLNFPSGLVLYFITNNILSIIQQWWMLRGK